MKIFFMVLIVLLFMGKIVSMGQTTSQYLMYINSPYARLSFEEASKIELDELDEINKGLLLFTLANTSRQEERVSTALQYWTNLYEMNTYRNAVTRAYQGSLQSMLGGATKKVTNKIKFSRAGMEILREANETVKKMDDDLAIGYVAFLTGNTYSFFPAFFKEFKKETLGFLKTAEVHLKKVERLGVYSPSLINNVLALNNLAKGRYYEKSKKEEKAKTYYEKALVLAKSVEGDNRNLLKNINQAIYELEQ